MHFLSFSEKNRSLATDNGEISAQLGTKMAPEKTEMSYFLFKYTSLWPERTDNAL